MSWRPYAARPGSTVTGTLLEWPEVGDANHAPRTLLAWLPPSYDSNPDRHYPVVYFHDSQNVFDTATSNSGEWEADETLTRLAGEGLEAIAVAIPHGGERRYHEYSPSRHPDFPPELGGGGADAYVAFLVGVVKPLVDGSLRTRSDAGHTALIGSSMGGVVSLHALLTRPDVFGGAGVMSPALWACPDEAFSRVRRSPTPTGRLWLDIGGREGPDDPEKQRAYWEDAHALRDLLLEGGWARDCASWPTRRGCTTSGRGRGGCRGRCGFCCGPRNKRPVTGHLHTGATERCPTRVRLSSHNSRALSGSRARADASPTCGADRRPPCTKYWPVTPS